ncbi:hypothetical protein NQZ68_008359 [Dissostichus eleginoides]|nr:hypothetical protein NQZ68_008359 [Dissostichus eleginoides]
MSQQPTPHIVSEAPLHCNTNISWTAAWTEAWRVSVQGGGGSELGLWGEQRGAAAARGRRSEGPQVGTLADHPTGPGVLESSSCVNECQKPGQITQV